MWSGSKGWAGGRGQGTAPLHTHRVRHRGQVRCRCKSSPKCFQAKANQEKVTEHTQAQPGSHGHSAVQVHACPQMQNHAGTCSAYRAVCTKGSHPYLDAQSHTCFVYTDSQSLLPLMFLQTQGTKIYKPPCLHMFTGRCTNAEQMEEQSPTGCIPKDTGMLSGTSLNSPESSTCVHLEAFIPWNSYFQKQSV